MSLAKIAALRVRAARVPLPEPHNTASGTVAESPLVLTDLTLGDGTVGHSLVFTYTPAALKPTADLIANLAPLVIGEPAAPLDLEQKLARRFRLLGPQGWVGIALAAIDMALWDAVARQRGLPLCGLLGAAPKPIPAYGAVGFDGERGSAATAERWARLGFTGVKAKIGYPTLAKDLAVVRAMRAAVGPQVAIMVDYNQSPRRGNRALPRARRRRPDLDRGAHARARLHRPRRARPRHRDPDPGRRKLVGHAPPATRARRAGERRRDARRDEDRRHDRLAARRGAGAAARTARVQSPVAGDLRAVARGHAERALARIRGLVESDPRRAAGRARRHGRARRCAGQRRRLERRRRSALSLLNPPGAPKPVRRGQAGASPRSISSKRLIDAMLRRK
jgi:hypothetical protein